MFALVKSGRERLAWRAYKGPVEIMSYSSFDFEILDYHVIFMARRWCP